MDLSFHKAERLSHKALFDELFEKGESFIKYPFRVVVKKSSLPGPYPCRIAISVSKKKFKSAVQRNRIKRLTREAYRLHKKDLYLKIEENTTFDIIFIFLDQQLPAFPKIEKAMKNILEHLIVRTDKIYS